MTPVAHSPRGEVPAQAYREHIENVRQQAVGKAQFATTKYTGDRTAFIDAVETAAIYHDLGKLDEVNQEVLRRESNDPLPVAHEDAGVAELLKLRRRESAVLVAAHHAGLFSQEAEICKERSKRGRAFRNPKVADQIDKQLENYVALHSAAGCPTPGWIESGILHKCGFTRRVALSCLVDADHSDTARHYGNEVRHDQPEPRWYERLASLDQYVARLPEGSTERERHRNYLSTVRNKYAAGLT